MFQKILVAIDGSEHSHKAVTIATELAQHYHSSLCLLHAFPHVADYLGYPIYDERINKSILEGQALLDQMKDEIADAVPVETQLIEGPPAPAILRVAEAEGYDLIVVGSRTHHPMVNLLQGNVTSTLTEKANCPVIIVP